MRSDTYKGVISLKNLLIIGLTVLFLVPVVVNADENNKIAVASLGENADAPVSSQGARCPYYIIFDGTGTLIEVVDNPYKNTSGGAGPSAASFLARKNVTVLIAGNFGPKMIHSLRNNKITHLQFKGTVGDALKKALEGS